MESSEGRIEVSGTVIADVEARPTTETITLETDPVHNAVGATSPLATEPGEPAKIDPPTPDSMRRKIRLRDGDRCQNPGCGAPADHCHHVRWRGDAGKTVVENLVAVCARCHGLIHEKLLALTGSPETGLEWIPCSEQWRRAAEPKERPREGEKSLDLPGAAVDAGEDSGPRDEPGDEVADSARAESARPQIDLPKRLRRPPILPRSAEESARADSIAGLVPGLVRLGFSEKEAHARLSEAAAHLRAEGTAWDEAKLVAEAVRAKPG